MSEHTPGPWTARETHDEGPSAVWADDGMPVAFCFYPREGSDFRANTNLIAAAPDLLAALEAVLEPCGSCDYGVIGAHCTCRTWHALAVPAITKARGEAVPQ